MRFLQICSAFGSVQIVTCLTPLFFILHTNLVPRCPNMYHSWKSTSGKIQFNAWQIFGTLFNCACSGLESQQGSFLSLPSVSSWRSLKNLIYCKVKNQAAKGVWSSQSKIRLKWILQDMCLSPWKQRRETIWEQD